MNTFYKQSFVVACLLLSSIACTRKENDQSAGKGGAAILRIVPKHHNEYKNIVNAKIYIKYNAQDVPSSFDDSVNCTTIGDQPTGTFSSLRSGKYYIYGTGYDTSIKQAVKGGIPYIITQETSLDISVPVTESH